jgi:hypothetical protein
MTYQKKFQITEYFSEISVMYYKIWRIQTFLADPDPQFRKTDPDTKGRLIKDPPDPRVQNTVFKVRVFKDLLITLICPLLFQPIWGWGKLAPESRKYRFPMQPLSAPEKLQSQHCSTSKIKKRFNAVPPDPDTTFQIIPNPTLKLRHVKKCSSYGAVSTYFAPNQQRN